MNKLIFKVSNSGSTDIASLLTEIKNIECRMKFDLELGVVTFENVNANHINMVTDFMGYYELLELEIDNLNLNNGNEPKQLSVNPVQPENSPSALCKESLTNSDGKGLTQKIDLDNTASVIPDNFIVNKISFQNSNIEYALNKLARTSHWAVYKHDEPEKEVIDCIWTAIREMSMKFNQTPIVDFEIGDVVECYMGEHLPKELNGSNVLGIVANIFDDNLVYIVPLTNTSNAIDADTCLPFSIPGDITSIDSDSDIDSGTVLFNGARYIRAERVTKVVGKVIPAFMQKVLTKLSCNFDFTEKYLSLIPNLESNSSSNDEEIVLSQVIEDALNALNPKEPIATIANRFICNINMDPSDKLLVQSFIASYTIPKITYKNIYIYINQNVKSIELSEKQIELYLKNTFKTWISSNPKLANCQYLEFTSLLKLFNKTLKKDS